MLVWHVVINYSVRLTQRALRHAAPDAATAAPRPLGVAHRHGLSAEPRRPSWHAPCRNGRKGNVYELIRVTVDARHSSTLLY